MSLIDSRTGKLKKWKEVATLPKTRIGGAAYQADLREKAAFKILGRLSPVAIEGKSETEIEFICMLGPKKLYRLNMLRDSGWRRGYTK